MGWTQKVTSREVIYVGRHRKNEPRQAASERRAGGDVTGARYLLLATDDGVQGSHSGYTRLSDHIEHGMLIRAQRSDPRKLHERALVRMLACGSGSRWYRLGSMKVEWRAWQAVRNGFSGLIHLLWADRDWGFLDQVPTCSVGSTLCATFHGCPDTLPEVVQNTHRLRHFAAIILMSEGQRSFFESHGVSKDRIHVIPHGVDCQYFSPDLSARSSQFTILFVGNYRRNFSLLRKLCSILEPYNEIKIKVVAPKSRTDEFRDHKNVTAASDLSNEELRNCYREASCLLMTLEASTANNAILEGMACALPIISENIGGVAEYTGTRCAKLCAPDSVEELLHAILTLYENHNMVVRMSLDARVRATEFDWPLIAERTVALYEDVVAESRGKLVSA